MPRGLMAQLTSMHGIGNIVQSEACRTLANFARTLVRGQMQTSHCQTNAHVYCCIIFKNTGGNSLHLLSAHMEFMWRVRENIKHV